MVRLPRAAELFDSLCLVPAAVAEIIVGVVPKVAVVAVVAPVAVAALLLAAVVDDLVRATNWLGNDGP